MTYDPNANYAGNDRPQRPALLSFTPEEIATNLRVTRRTVYRWLTEGTLRGVKVDGIWQIPETEIATMLTRRGYSFNPTSWARDDFAAVAQAVGR